MSSGRPLFLRQTLVTIELGLFDRGHVSMYRSVRIVFLHCVKHVYLTTADTDLFTAYSLTMLRGWISKRDERCMLVAVECVKRVAYIL